MKLHLARFKIYHAQIEVKQKFSQLIDRLRKLIQFCFLYELRKILIFSCYYSFFGIYYTSKSFNSDIQYINNLRLKNHLSDIYYLILLRQSQIKQMNKIADRRRMHSLAMINQQEDLHLQRITTTSNVLNNVPPSLDQMRKTIKELQTLLKNEKELRIQAEQNLKLHQTRTIFRQRQFYKILQQSDQKVRSYVTTQQNSNIVKQIKKSYQNILRNFERTNEATNSMIQAKYKQTLAAMQRRIQSINSIMNEQVARTKMMSSKNINQIRKQIQQAISLLKNVECQNLQLKINIKKEIHKNKLIQQQRKLLLEEVVNKKFAICKLIEENKKLKKKYKQTLQKDKLSNQHKSKTIDKQVRYDLSLTSLGNKNMRPELNICNHAQTKQTTPQKQKLTKFFGQNLSFTQKIDKQRYYNTTIAKSRFSQCIQKSNKLKQQDHSKSKQSSKISQKQKGNHIAQINYKKLQRKYTKRDLAKKNIIFCDEDEQNLLTLAKNNTLNTQTYFDNSIQSKNNNQKTIQHLKICLQREKKKVYSLGKIVTRIQNSNQQVNQAIISALQEARSKSIQGKQYLQNFLKCQKLLKLISDMKKRLSVCEIPTVQCGWGQLQIEQFITETDIKYQNVQPNKQSTIFFS